MCLFADLGSEAEAFHRRKNGDGKISRVFGFVHPSSLSSCPLIGAFFSKIFQVDIRITEILFWCYGARLLILFVFGSLSSLSSRLFKVRFTQRNRLDKPRSK